MSVPGRKAKPGVEGPCALAALLVCLSGCTTIRAELRDRTDALATDYRRRAVATLFSPADAVADWAPGQYAVYLSEHDGEPSLVRYAVDAVSSTDVRLRVQHLGYRGRATYWLHYERTSIAGHDATVLERITVRPDSGPEYTLDVHPGTEHPEPLLPVWFVLSMDRLEAPPKTVHTPAGRFEGCFTVRGRTPLEGAAMTGWAHGAVPVLGLVEATSLDGATRVRLVEHGLDGSGSLF